MRYPSLVIDQQIALLNIKKMVGKAVKNRIELRPHFKTHQSHKIGKWFKQQGVKGITVSSLKMAEYFASDGWSSITLAFPVNILEIDGLNRLASEIDLRVLIANKEALLKLDNELSNRLGIYIELDPGYNRSGVSTLDFNELIELKNCIASATNLKFEGFYTHAGHSYKCRSKKEVQNLSASIMKDLTTLKTEFDSPICFGDTPSCSILNSFDSIDQISPGNFIFYDWTQYNIGSCNPNEIALAMYCPIVAKYPERNELLIHGGAVHFSKDSLHDENGMPYFGVLAEKNTKGWGSPLPENTLTSISQEHGIIKCTSDYFNKVKVGDIIPILPIHSCLTANLMAEYYSVSGEYFDHMNQKVLGRY